MAGHRDPGYLIFEIGEEEAHIIFDSLDEYGHTDEDCVAKIPFTQLPRLANVLQRAAAQFSYLYLSESEQS